MSNTGQRFVRVMATIMVVTGQGQRGRSVSVSSEQTSETQMKKKHATPD